MKKINDLQKNEQIADLPAMVNSVVSGTTSNGSPYLTVSFNDNSGSIDAKVWSVTERDIQVCKVGKIVLVSGAINLYQNNLQLKVTKLESVDNSQFNISDFVLSAPVSISDLDKSIRDTLAKMENINIRRIVAGMLNRYSKDFFEYPAASKNHHEFFSGLAMHVKSMVDLATVICDLYPSLNRDLLYGGIILHDLGKCVELSGPIATEYTTEGKLLGHISIMQAEVYELAKELELEKSEECMLLRHMILSHHGKYEFGSPVLPLFKEAEMLSYIDNIDARMNMFEKVLDKVEKGEFTSRVFSLENRSVYKPKI